MTSKNSPTPINFLRYHRPKLRLYGAPIPELNAQSKRCLKNLASYRFSRPPIPIPRSRSAAVLVSLFVGRQGDLYVLLSRRSSTLRTYAGDTSLPGGKTDEGDASPEDTARREAFEEIGLPRDRKKVPLLCVLEPFVAGNGIVVTPVVVLILDNSLQVKSASWDFIQRNLTMECAQPILNRAEVTSLFSHPLGSFLTTEAPYPTESETLEVPYYSHSDWDQPGPNGQVWPHRAHRFLTGREAGGVKPVFGLTAGIMIQVATIAYGHPPEFEVQLTGAPSLEARLAWALLSNQTLHEACEKEGLKMDWDMLRRICGADQKYRRGRPHKDATHGSKL